MATVTLGTTLTTSLTAVMYDKGASQADYAAICNAILDDKNPAHPIIPGSYVRDGLLFIPRRGVLKIAEGDYVGVDSSGWPILVSSNSIANAAWTHT